MIIIPQINANKIVGKIEYLFSLYTKLRKGEDSAEPGDMSLGGILMKYYINTGSDPKTRNLLLKELKRMDKQILYSLYIDLCNCSILEK